MQLDNKVSLLTPFSESAYKDTKCETVAGLFRRQQETASSRQTHVKGTLHGF